MNFEITFILPGAQIKTNVTSSNIDGVCENDLDIGQVEELVKKMFPKNDSPDIQVVKPFLRPVNN